LDGIYTRDPKAERRDESGHAETGWSQAFEQMAALVSGR
jgi:hypothetical protein